MSLKISDGFNMLAAFSALSLPSLGLASTDNAAQSHDELPKVSGQISLSTSQSGTFSSLETSLNFGKGRLFRAISVQKNGRKQFDDFELRLDKFSLYYGKDFASSPSTRFTATWQENRHHFFGFSQEQDKASSTTAFGAVPLTDKSSIQGSFKDGNNWRVRYLRDQGFETLSIGGGNTPSGRTVNLDWNSNKTRVNLRWKEHDAPDLRIISGQIPKSMSANSGDVKERGINALENDSFGWPQFSLDNFDLGPGGLPGVYLPQKAGSDTFELKLKPRERFTLTGATRLSDSKSFQNPYALFQLQDTKGIRGAALEVGANLHGGYSLRGRIDFKETQRPLLSFFGSLRF